MLVDICDDVDEVSYDEQNNVLCLNRNNEENINREIVTFTMNGVESLPPDYLDLCEDTYLRFHGC